MYSLSKYSLSLNFFHVHAFLLKPNYVIDTLRTKISLVHVKLSLVGKKLSSSSVNDSISSEGIVPHYLYHLFLLLLLLPTNHIKKNLTPFCHRYKIRGIRNLIFYGPPDHPQFYTEFLSYPFLDEGVDASDVTCRVLYSKYDWMRLERIAGTAEAAKLTHRLLL